jgi:ATP-binding cassette subfamily B protein
VGSGVVGSLLASAAFAVTFVVGGALAFGVAGAAALGGATWVAAWAGATVLCVIGLLVHLAAAGAATAAAGAVVRRRLLDAACEADEHDETTDGSARMAVALDVDALDRAAIGAGLFTAQGTLEVLVGAVVLLVVGAGPAALAALAASVGVVAWSSVRLVRSQRSVAGIRMQLSIDTTEALLGHRTRLVQSAPEVDEHLRPLHVARYASARRAADRWTVLIGSVVPGSWRVVGLLLVVAGAVDTTRSPGQVAALLGGVLLVAEGLVSFGAGGREAAEALVAADAVAPRMLIPRATVTQTVAADRLAEVRSRAATGDGLVCLVDVDLDVGCGPTARRAVSGVSMAVYAGDRVLMTGPSGAGKSTLIRALAALHPVASGVRVLGPAPGSADGDAVRVVSVPQFHRNHVFMGTVAFNVLMGRGWPATAEEEDHAEELCRALGLGPLLDRMPSGMRQAVGEMGWRLSHGERSRIFVARALAQQPDVLLLDESFGALDPATLRTCLEAIEARCPTIVMVAHP